MQLRKMKPQQIFIAVYGQSPLPVIAPRRELPCPFISRHDNNSLHPCACCLKQCILTLWLLSLISQSSKAAPFTESLKPQIHLAQYRKCFPFYKQQFDSIRLYCVTFFESCLLAINRNEKYSCCYSANIYLLFLAFPSCTSRPDQTIFLMSRDAVDALIPSSSSASGLVMAPCSRT